MLIISSFLMICSEDKIRKAKAFLIFICEFYAFLLVIALITNSVPIVITMLIGRQMIQF